jgi:outer membrane murein-binding lipoprotein Lpp
MNLKSQTVFFSIVLSVGLLTGCASNGELGRVRSEAQEARSVAEQALETAQEAKQIAEEADSRAMKSEEMLNRSFKRSMYK